MSARSYEALTTDDVAELLCVTERQIRTWIKDKGMPSRKDGRTPTFIWRDTLAWYVEYKASLARYAAGPQPNEPSNDPIHRKDSAVASLKELELEQRQGQLIRMGDVLETFGSVAKGMQTEIRGLPTRIVQQVLGITDRDEMVTFLTEETNNLCTRLSQLRFDNPPAEPEDE